MAHTLPPNPQVPLAPLLNVQYVSRGPEPVPPRPRPHSLSSTISAHHPLQLVLHRHGHLVEAGV